MTRGARTVKLVVTGPLGVGKTTFIEAVSEIAVVSTERPVSDADRSLKAATTVAMDFGRITVADDLALHLFGTPGQARFDFMWEILAEGMLGFVLLVDHARPASMAEAVRILEFFTGAGSVPYIVAVNKVEGADAEALVRRELGLEASVDVVVIDARAREDVKHALLRFLETLQDEIAAPAVLAEV